MSYNQHYMTLSLGFYMTLSLFRRTSLGSYFMILYASTVSTATLALLLLLLLLLSIIVIYIYNI